MTNYLWKYMAFDKFKSLLENKALFIPSLKFLQETMDPIEGKIFSYFQNKVDDEIKFYYSKLNIDRMSVFGRYVTIGEKLKNRILMRKYIYSLTYDNAENYSLWKIYTTEIDNKNSSNPQNGIALKINPIYFKKTFCNSYIEALSSIKSCIEIEKTIFEKVCYKSNKDIMDMINNKDYLNEEYFKKKFEEIYHNAMFVKSNYYKFAKEKRYVVSINRNSDEEFNNIWLSINLSDFFENCKIILSPFSDEDFEKKVKNELKKHNIKNINSLVLKSEILLP